jgi:hypothetical protein
MQWRIAELTDKYLSDGHTLGTAIKLAVQDVTHTGLDIQDMSDKVLD